ncbi:hypothetical protein C8A00DRAFT_43345 [Chaetomidium leptoderma]|uniref:Uncharacterized protein n=1 Tax=Chaetomidium leptoderma TaxID=669021 RepID=A0AAN6VN09_9PEZI|nr:hypothetical protein C8A00DRAFT_43345 [Chaetomidium leptoderma]
MLCTKLPWLAIVATWLAFSAQANPFPTGGGLDRYPRRTIAGVSVIDTPLKCIMRCWLLGTLMLQHNNTLQSIVDPEVHAIASILHDLDFDRSPNSTIFTLDHRFEVDGAIAARNFIRAHRHGNQWEERRVQLVWDAIALHGEDKIALFKEPEVAAVTKSVALDFSGPALGVTAAEYAAVMGAFPQDNFKASVIETTTWLCRTKPETTYETFLQPYGERFVPGYSAVGHRAIDLVLGMSSG